MRAGFFNETICLAFLTPVGLMGPSISPVPILVCLSPPAWPHHPRPALRGFVAGLASDLRVYSSHLATAGLRAESLAPSACPRCGTVAASSWLSRCHVAAHACSGCQGLHTRGEGTVNSFVPACTPGWEGWPPLRAPQGPEGHVVHLLSLKEGGFVQSPQPGPGFLDARDFPFCI